MTAEAVAEGIQKKRPRRDSGMTRRASMLTTQEQRTLTRESSRKPKKAKEHRAIGSVDRKVYKEYVKANGVSGVVLYVGPLFSSLSPALRLVSAHNTGPCSRNIHHDQRLAQELVSAQQECRI